MKRGFEDEQALEAVCDQLQLITDATCTGPPGGLRPNIRKLRDILTGMQSHFRYLLGSRYYHERSRNSSRRLNKRLFDVSELAEQVFSYSDIVDLLSAQQVNRRCKAIIDGSTSLQRLML